MLRRLLLTIILFVGMALLPFEYLCADSFTQSVGQSSPIQQIYENLKNSTYMLFGVQVEGSSKYELLGGAVAINKTLLVTNCHVALAGNFISVKINNQYEIGRIFYHNDIDDLCIVEIPNANFIPVKIRPSKDVRVGEEIFTIGNPEGFEKSITKGIVSNVYDKNNLPLHADPKILQFMKHICVNDNQVILQIDAPTSHGSSGGGLFDKDGNLIGLTTFADLEGENLNFAIPTELILHVLNPENNESKETINTAQTDQPNQKLEDNKQESTPNASQTNSLSDKSASTSDISRLGYFGNSQIGLIKINGTCFIAIAGRYRPGKPTSLAIWFPSTPKTLFIFSRSINVNDAIESLESLISIKNTKYIQSKSFIYIDSKLSNLAIASVNDEKYPVYVFNSDKDQAETFIDGDYFLGQFYHYFDNDMTTIRFDLDGFTQALNAYNESCKK